MRRTTLLFLWPLLASVGQTSAAPLNTAAVPGLSTPHPAHALQDFLTAYWDAKEGYFLAWNRSAPFSRPSGSGPRGGKYTDFWWEAGYRVQEVSVLKGRHEEAQGV